MQALVLDRAGGPLRLTEMSFALLMAGQVRIAVGVCGVCRTDLHVVAGSIRKQHQIKSSTEVMKGGNGSSVKIPAPCASFC